MMRRMRIPSDHPLLLRIVDDLAANGWSQQNIFLPDSLTLELEQECRKRAAEASQKPNDLARSGQLELPRPHAVAPHQRNPYAIPAIAILVSFYHG